MTYYETPETTEDALAHFGVLGMKWGHHNPEKKAQKQHLKELDKASKARDTAARDAEIETARNRYNTTARKKYLDAKAQYEIDKKTIGKREAAKKFDAVKQQNMDDFEIGNQAKSGKEARNATLAVVGTVALAVVLSAASAAVGAPPRR